jgi:maltose O-acetyltransferase
MQSKLKKSGQDLRYEVIMWYWAFIERIPGYIGCRVRNSFLPYKHGTGVTIWDGVHIDHPSKLTVGNRVSINRGTVLAATGGITIGDDVLIGPSVTIYSQNHRFEVSDKPFNVQGYDRSPVVIGSNVWIAANVTILPGVTIGDDVVIGAGSVITSDVDSGTLTVGNPGRVTRRFSHD